LDAAFRDTKKIEKEAPLPEEVVQAALEVTEKVVEQLRSLAEKGASLTVEGIQDLVEVTLMKCDHHDVARDYIIYRDSHKSLREDSPQNLTILRQDGIAVRFNPMKIASAIETAFRRTRKLEAPSPQDVVDAVNLLTQNVVARAISLSKSGVKLSVLIVQEEIEQQMMRAGFFAEVKELILFRASQGEEVLPANERYPAQDEGKSLRQFTIHTEGGKTHLLNEKELRARLQFACRAFERLVSCDELLESSIGNFYEGMKESEVDMANIMAARSKIEVEPAYATVASRLLLDVLYRETLGISASDPELESVHRAYFKNYFQRGITFKRIHPDLLQFDLDKLATAIQLQRDDLFSYLGLQTLYDRYFIHEMQKRLETPQIFWMRVAMGLALSEKEKKNEKAIEFYDILSKFLFVSSTPTLFNSGTLHPQLSSCYLSTVMDDLSHIFKVISDDAQLSKWAGGIGNDWTNVRATGSVIKGTNGRSQGVIPFLKVANDTAVAVNQCFSPETLLYTAKGIKPIIEVHPGDLVLGASGIYREVVQQFSYQQ
ncbi:MAG: ribonucleotide reductase N-terminal alpha domain-containing protein, partial [Chlamydiales bacterium]